MPDAQESPRRLRTYQRQRRQMTEALRERGISDEHVLEAFAAVPRHRFVDAALRQRAYTDEALPIGMHQTISQPFTVAYQTMLLDVAAGDRVLEIGTGSGYQAAILCEMGARVFSIERHEALLLRTRRLLDALGYRVVTRHGDGTFGWATFAPYDGILVTAGAAEAPRPLLEQLRAPEGGRHVEDQHVEQHAEKHRPGGGLIIPIGDAGGQQMHRITRIGPGTEPGDYEREALHDFRFVPLIGEGGGGMK